jgi:hypothetical protein
MNELMSSIVNNVKGANPTLGGAKAGGPGPRVARDASEGALTAASARESARLVIDLAPPNAPDQT